MLVERAGPVARALRQNLDRLDCADRVRLEQADALDFLRDCRERFDLVFLDPPFAGDLWQAALAALDDAAVLLPTARVYLEAPAGAPEPTLESHWRLLRQVRQGEVVGRLYAVESPENCSGPDDQALSPLPLP